MYGGILSTPNLFLEKKYKSSARDNTVVNDKIYCHANLDKPYIKVPPRFYHIISPQRRSSIKVRQCSHVPQNQLSKGDSCRPFA